MNTTFRFRGRPDGHFEQMDPAFFEYTGLCERDVYGRSDGWMDAVHPNDVERARAMWQLAAMHLDQYDLELRLRSARGTYETLRGTVVPVWENGELVAWDGTATILP
jgi:PAS domain-containing protein